jgi:hypothetical protein
VKEPARVAVSTRAILTSCTSQSRFVRRPVTVSRFRSRVVDKQRRTFSNETRRLPGRVEGILVSAQLKNPAATQLINLHGHMVMRRFISLPPLISMIQVISQLG